MGKSQDARSQEAGAKAVLSVITILVQRMRLRGLCNQVKQETNYLEGYVDGAQNHGFAISKSVT